MFALETQDEADKAKLFPRRKVTLPNGIVLHTRWYAPPKIERSELKLRSDVTLPNGIVLRASTYRPPCYGGAWGRMSAHEVRAMDAKYRHWLEHRKTKKARRRKTAAAVCKDRTNSATL